MRRVASPVVVAVVAALSVAAALVVVPAPGGDSSALLGSAPAAAASSTQGPASSGGHSPAVAFTALEYPVRFFDRIFNADEATSRRNPSAGEPMWFGKVNTAGRSDDLDLSFAVEGQHDPSGYQFCETPSTCDDVNVRVTSTGLLYLHKQQRTEFQWGFFADFPTRAVELSAADADSSLKVYREVLVGPPTAVTGCEDYGENNPDAYACLFLRELLPSNAAAGVDESALRDGLPGLVQDADKYRLVFAEEFDGTPPPPNSAGCSDGMSTLDSVVWAYNDISNYRDACHSSNTDSKGEPCGNVVDGKLVFALSGQCGFGLTTNGKFHVKYGYVEFKFTFNADSWPTYGNYNIILYSRGEKLRFLLDRYGVEIEDWEDFLTNLDTEIDMVEYETYKIRHIGHQYGNYHYKIADFDVRPIWSTRWYSYCDRSDISIVENPNLPCKHTDTFTVTLGIEWTPRGYRSFTKVDGIGDELAVVPKDKIDVNTRHVSRYSSRPGEHRKVTGDARDAYFEYIDPDDPDSLLEKVAVSHVPLPLSVGAWGWPSSTDHPYIRTRMQIDYIRVWQPENHYSDMEPVYQ